MLKKILRVLQKDFKTSRRDFMAVYIMIAPILIAIAIAIFTPGLNDTTVNLAMLESDDAEHIEYMEQFAKVELFESVGDMESRVEKRDDLAALIPVGDNYEILLQGNEPEAVETFAVTLEALYELDATKDRITSYNVCYTKLLRVRFQTNTGTTMM